jgi:hypothetical protein
MPEAPNAEQSLIQRLSQECLSVTLARLQSACLAVCHWQRFYAIS